MPRAKWLEEPPNRRNLARSGLEPGQDTDFDDAMLQTGLLSVTFRRLLASEVLAWAREAGVQGIEWGGDVHVPHGDVAVAREIGQRTRDAGLQVSAYGSYYRAGASEAAGLAFDRVLESALALGAPTVRIWAGVTGSNETDARTRAAVVAEVRRVADLARAAGLRLATEWHGGTLTDTRDSALRLLDEVGSPPLTTFWQPRVGDTVEAGLADLQAIGDRLGHVHAFHWWPTPADRRPLAEGGTAWRRYLQAIALVPGDRFVSLEFLPQETQQDLRRDTATLRAWLAGV